MENGIDDIYRSCKSLISMQGDMYLQLSKLTYSSVSLLKKSFVV
jgi:hypothetical protein